MPKAMFHSYSSFPQSCRDTDMHPRASFPAAPPALTTYIPRASYLDSNGGSFPPFTIAASSSPPSYSSSSHYRHRSISSQCLPLHVLVPEPGLNPNAFLSSSYSSPHNLSFPPLSSSPASSSGDLLEFSSGSMRRVFSTGDLQGMKGSPPPASGDHNNQEGGGGAFSQKVGRYSAEERKERIERYRIKRHQRNFNKKITYACRKTLADNRPRVKGRFARNGETEAEAEADLEREVSENSYEYCDYSNGHNNGSSMSGCNNNSSNCYYGHRDSSNGIGGENGDWWRPVPMTTKADEVEQLGFYDDDLWASLGDVLSVNLSS